MHVFKGEGQQPATPCLHGSDRMGNWERTLRSGNTRGDSTLSPLASGGTRCYRRHGRAPCCRIRICTRDTTHWCIHTCTRCNAFIMVVPVTIVVQSGGHDGPEGGRIHLSPSLSVRKAAWTPAVKTDWLAPVGVAPVVTPRDAYTQPPAPSTTPRRPIAPHATPTPPYTRTHHLPRQCEHVEMDNRKASPSQRAWEVRVVEPLGQLVGVQYRASCRPRC